MTQEDYDNDLVFRSGGKEYVRAGSSIVLRESTEEVIRVDEEGFHYNGQSISDAGEAHRLLVEFLKKHTA
jgi:hypothetical protein